MRDQSVGKTPLHQRALTEFQELLAITVYLYVCLGSLILFKAAILQNVGVELDVWGLAIVKALVLAKFMLIGHALHLGQERYKHHALIWPTLYQTLLTLGLLLILTTLEKLLIGWIHSEAIATSMTQVVGSSFLQAGATCLIMFLILLPYFAFRNLGEVLGEGVLLRLFLTDRHATLAMPTRTVD